MEGSPFPLNDFLRKRLFYKIYLSQYASEHNVVTRKSCSESRPTSTKPQNHVFIDLHIIGYVKKVSVLFKIFNN